MKIENFNCKCELRIKLIDRNKLIINLSIFNLVKVRSI